MTLSDLDIQYQPLDAQSEIPIYKQLYYLLRELITSGEFKPGERLESERNLAAFYGISRMTVREATRLLIQDGYLYASQGRGLFVAKILPRKKMKLINLSEDIKVQELVHSLRVAEATTVTAPADIAGRLRITEGECIHRLKRVWVINDIPFGVETSYFPSARFPNLLDHDFSAAPLLQILKETLGISLGYAEQSVDMALPSPEVRALLGLKETGLLSAVERITYDTDEQIVEYMVGTYRLNQYNLTLFLPAI